MNGWTAEWTMKQTVLLACTRASRNQWEQWSLLGKSCNESARKAVAG
uniref:Uncharacterized protein n=1 Tax=Peronospora matthiolae TaxID=2874970 RepID=A0AAV1SZL3_9STRA